MADLSDSDCSSTPTPSSVKKIRTPRAETATILARSGSGPMFAGDEDRYFLDGIEEVLATWQPEVGGMPPIDNKALELPPRELAKIKTPSMKAKSMRAVLRDADHEESELEISESSVEPPRFEGIDDGVFLDGLEEVVPDVGQAEGSAAAAGDAKDDAGGAECKGVGNGAVLPPVLTPQDIPVLAVSTGHIRAPKWNEVGGEKENTAAEGPEFRGLEDAMFHEGVEEVVAGWQDAAAAPGRSMRAASGAAELVAGSLDVASPFAAELVKASLMSAAELDDSKDIGDRFFHDGLEEVSTPNPDADLVGFMPHVDVPELPRDECPPRITTAKPGGLPPSPEHQAPPTWDPENDTTFLDPDALVDSPTKAESRMPNPLANVDLPQKKLLRVRTYSKDELVVMPSRRSALTALPGRNTQSSKVLPVRGISGGATPTNTPTGDPGECVPLAGVASSLVVQVDPAAGGPSPTTTPFNTPMDSGNPNTPVASRSSGGPITSAAVSSRVAAVYATCNGNGND